MRVALNTLWERSIECGQPFAQVDVHPCEGGAVAVTAYFRDGRDTSVDFEEPQSFDALACRRAFGAHLNVE